MIIALSNLWISIYFYSFHLVLIKSAKTKHTYRINSHFLHAIKPTKNKNKKRDATEQIQSEDAASLYNIGKLMYQAESRLLYFGQQQ